MIRQLLSVVLLLTVAIAPASAAQRKQKDKASPKERLRFVEMDQNRDGVITRAEWRGGERSFEVHDWNSDNVLSGEEVRIGGTRRDRPITTNPDFDSPDREYTFDDWTERGFVAVDHNRDNRISRDEWHFDRESFLRADHNGDNAISRAEFLGEDDDDDDRDDRFVDLDSNRDGRVSQSEWHGSASRFAALDRNRDRSLSRSEMVGENPPADLFSSVDVNRDQQVTREEWHWSDDSFDQRDSNRDGRLTAAEFGGSGSQPGAGSAYPAGLERGLAEGRAAGREDRDRNQGWDLEGQRELETADSGYNPGMGAKADYQRGYREGFRRAYREGWDRK